MTILYFWANDYPQNTITLETGVTSKTVIDWCNPCREICAQHLERNPFAIGGLDENFHSKVVEIGESKYFHN